ncbi:MAG: copper chaperone PCu(A)C [Acidimicrobiales bacterium]
MAGKKTVTVAGLLLGGGLLVATACSSSSETSSGTTTTAKATATTAPAKGITVSEPWCRATAESATTGACYMTISNGDKTADKLTKVSVPTSVAAEAQLHETTMSEGGGTTGTTMKMGGDSMGGGTTGTTMKKGTAASSSAQAELTAYGHNGEDDGDGETDTSMKGGTTGTTMGGGAMGMQEVSSIEIPAGGSVQLKPGGYHIMLMELAAPLKKGETVAITLTFEKGGNQTVQAQVKDA